MDEKLVSKIDIDDFYDNLGIEDDDLVLTDYQNGVIIEEINDGEVD